MGRRVRWRSRWGLILAAALAAFVTAGGPSGAETKTPSSNSPPLSTESPPPLPGAKRPPPVVAPEAPAPKPPDAGAAPAPKTPDAGAAPTPRTPDTGAAPKPKSPPGEDMGSGEPKPSGDASSAKPFTLEARPVAILKGQADWEEGFKTITTSLETIQAALAKANIKQVGHPLTVFRETDDNGFKYEAMIPIDPSTDTKAKLDSNVTFGQSPAGKTLKFQHRGAYEEIDSTYEAITAYLDEKGYDTKNLFIEEYLNKVKSADDTDFQVDIYVMVK